MGFDAASLGKTSLIMQGAGAVTSGIGSYFSAAAAKDTLKTQANILDTNARIAELGAQSALNQGQKQIAALTLKVGQIKGAQRASMAANGIDLGVGNAAEVQATTDIMKEIDANTIEANAVRTAWGYRSEAANIQNEATMKRAGAAGISPGMAAATSLLGSAGRVATSWYSMNKQFGGDSPNNGNSVVGSGSRGSVPGYSDSDLGSGLRIG